MTLLVRYQERATLARNLPEESIFKSDYCLIGLFGEAGEVANIIKKLLYRGADLKDIIGHDPNEEWVTYRDRLCSELGDCCYYAQAIVSELDTPLVVTPLTNRLNTVPQLLRLLVKDIASIDPYLSPGKHTPALAASIVPFRIGRILNVIFHLGDAFGISKGEILDGNLAKLAMLYPDRY